MTIKYKCVLYIPCRSRKNDNLNGQQYTAAPASDSLCGFVQETTTSCILYAISVSQLHQMASTMIDPSPGSLTIISKSALFLVK